MMGPGLLEFLEQGNVIHYPPSPPLQDAVIAVIAMYGGSARIYSTIDMFADNLKMFWNDKIEEVETDPLEAAIKSVIKAANKRKYEETIFVPSIESKMLALNQHAKEMALMYGYVKE